MIESLPPPIGESPAFLRLLERVSRVAPLDRPVLVVGERGTGKELIAARLHFLSRRWDAAFIKLNCAALAENLIEAELFGHEAGAFTGATRRRLGRFELAHGGSLFLDEIANASLAVQEKVLRVIEYGEMERLGGTETLKVDVRVIAATNVDLPAEAEAGRFRHDLLDRLAFDVLTVPPLRAREGDVALLAQHFGRAMAHELDWPAFKGFSGDAVAQLEAYAWPGNVRELRNVVERALAHAASPDRPISTLAFDPFESPYRPLTKPREPAQSAGEPAAPVACSDPQAPFDFRAAVAAYEEALLGRALAAKRHNQRATARHLGLSYDQLRNALRKHGLLAPRQEPGA
ncbi:MAG: phage shock protein operon transcriptional activator [Kiloniellales bacterium]|nr:phage shock protein operon transcriptional activator [Kiloniellales bacterium]